ncbi:hypothetical protein ENUP19_0315G0003 [Entamoeba nuttalli]|uniref:TLDc domain-containing protein n=2 Tax=Entamoeba nuttalli TaxID=412467 RepID=K2H7E5_ENTNP|nr:hypothetical protein ENU1_019090 [Entamoeba nuttalli P19]EKE42502.1 hypothetical protein ENU1_019090 [Entamoeba nuttalli P19]|eukprot:XP_008855165.1 hypothetical protein ENU1_019090 [Entamoeba nuttalli P19]
MTDEQQEMVVRHSKYFAQWTNRHCGYKKIFDTAVNGISNLRFNKTIMNIPHLIFICFGDYGNVYGTYCELPITTLDINSPDFEKNKSCHNFIFTLNSNGRIQDPQKFELINGKRGSIQLHEMDDPCLFDFGYGASRVYVHKPTSKKGYCKNLSRSYEKIKDNELIGCMFPQPFHTERVIVLQML